jgi:hypothetical protein
MSSWLQEQGQHGVGQHFCGKERRERPEGLGRDVGVLGDIPLHAQERALSPLAELVRRGGGIEHLGDALRRWLIAHIQWRCWLPASHIGVEPLFPTGIPSS